MEKVEIIVPGPEDGSKPAFPRAPAEVKRKPLAVDGKDRAVWLLGWFWCALVFEVLSYLDFYDAYYRNGFRLGAGITVLAVAFYALVWLYLGPPKTKSGQWLLAANLLLALTYALTSKSDWFRGWNLLFLLLLIPVQLYDWKKGEGRPWYDPWMLAQRWLGGLVGLFQNVGVNFDLAASLKKEKHKTGLWVLAGLAVAAGLGMIVVPLLMAADALFSQLAARWTAWLPKTALRWMVWLGMGLVLIPFLMSLLYSVRRPETAALPKVEGKRWALEPALWLTALAVLDGLYALFLGVQSVALFGGAEYLAHSGISYADYARSGFFQLVWVVFLNLSVLLLAVQLSRRGGKAWRAVQLLGTLLIVESGVLLASAAWRMTLYVTTFGLTFKRVLTYWGMLVAAIFLISALCKVWRPTFRFFRVLFGGSLVLWLALNAIDPAYLSAWYNVNAYQRGVLSTMDVSYLTELSYDVLGPLSRLPADFVDDHGQRLEEVIALERACAAEDCWDWRGWNLSAWLAAKREP